MVRNIDALVVDHALEQTGLTREQCYLLLSAYRNDRCEVVADSQTVTIVLPDTGPHAVPAVVRQSVSSYEFGGKQFSATSSDAATRLLTLEWYDVQPAWSVELDGPDDSTKPIGARLLSTGEVAGWFRSRAVKVDEHELNRLGCSEWILPDSTMAPAAVESFAPIPMRGDLPEVEAVTGTGYHTYNWYDLSEVANGGSVYRVTTGRDKGPSFWHFRREAGGWRPLVVTGLRWLELRPEPNSKSYPLDALIAGAELGQRLA